MSVHEVIHHGWLVKSPNDVGEDGVAATIFKKKWKERYFVLTYVTPLRNRSIKNNNNNSPNKTNATSNRSNNRSNNKNSATSNKSTHRASSTSSMNVVSYNCDTNNNNINNNININNNNNINNNINNINNNNSMIYDDNNNLNYNSSSCYNLNGSVYSINRANSLGNVHKLDQNAEVINHRAELTYYGDERMTKRLGSIDLSKCEEVLSHLKSKSFRYIFAIKTYVKKTRPRTYFLVTSTEEEMITWVSNLCKCLKMANDGVFNQTCSPPSNEVSNYYNMNAIDPFNNNINNNNIINTSNTNISNNNNPPSTPSTSHNRTPSVKQLLQRQISGLSTSRSRSANNTLERGYPSNNGTGSNNINYSSSNYSNGSNNSTPSNSVIDMIHDSNSTSSTPQRKINHLRYFNNSQNQDKTFYQQQQLHHYPHYYQQYTHQQQMHNVNNNPNNMTTFYNYPKSALHLTGSYDSAVPNYKSSIPAIVPPPLPDYKTFLPLLIPQQNTLDSPQNQFHSIYNSYTQNMIPNQRLHNDYTGNNLYKMPNNGYYDAPNISHGTLPKSRLQYSADQKLASYTSPEDKNDIYSAQFAENVLNLVSNLHIQSARSYSADRHGPNFHPTKQSTYTDGYYDFPKTNLGKSLSETKNPVDQSTSYDWPMSINPTYEPETPYDVPQAKLTVTTSGEPELPMRFDKLEHGMGGFDLLKNHLQPQFYTSLPEREDKMSKFIYSVPCKTYKEPNDVE